VIFEPTIIQGHQEDSTPRMSNLNQLQPNVEPASTEGTTVLRRSTRLRKEPERYMNGYIATVVDTCQNDGYECAMAYKAELQTENDTGLVDIQDARVYAAKKKKSYDEDCPNLFQAMNVEFAEKYLEATEKEIQTLIAQKTWKTVLLITKQADGTFYLTQTGLIEKVLKAAGLQDCNRCFTPASTTPVGSDVDGAPFIEDWEYASIVVMFMYLAANTRPDIAYAVHQAARYTHDPRASHSVAIKHILRYIKGTKDKGIYFKPDGTEKIDCYVDSDFAGLFSVEDKQQPISAKSRTGYVIMYSGVPIIWVSKMQTKIAFSTMEAEYIALSQSMRDLIPIREIPKERNKSHCIWR
jgi:hypothetical protein